jgi:hypothetical protein
LTALLRFQSLDAQQGRHVTEASPTISAFYCEFFGFPPHPSPH